MKQFNYLLLLILHYLASESLLMKESNLTDFDVPVCLISSRLKGSDDPLPGSKQIIAIGDIHGCFHGFIEVLRQAGITSSSDQMCRWRPEVENTILVQVGDIVDRGNATLQVWRCLENLQKTVIAANGSSMIRLIGNHDVWWLENQLHNRNLNTDTSEVIKEVTTGMRLGIKSGKILGAYTLRVQSLTIMFTHAGFRPEMMAHTKQAYRRLIGSNTTQIQPEQISLYVNKLVLDTINACNPQRCSFKDLIFEAGPERGGHSIGGPFWTDFSILAKAASKSSSHIDNIIQVVGHSIGFNRIRSTNLMQSIGIDSGMYVGGRAFLELARNGRFLAHEKAQSGGAWMTRDLTKDLCG